MIIKEVIHRLYMLLSEFNYSLHDIEYYDNTCSAMIIEKETKQIRANVFFESKLQFIEFSYLFSFSIKAFSFLRQHITTLLHTAYEYGCYIDIHAEQENINIMLASKIYFSGLNYDTLKATMRDLEKVAKEYRTILQFPNKQHIDDKNNSE